MSISIANARRGGQVVLAAWAAFAVGCSGTDNNLPGGGAGTGGGVGGSSGSSGAPGSGSAGQPDGGSGEGGVSAAGSGGALCGEAQLGLGASAYTPCPSAGSGGVSAGSGGVSAGSGGVSAGSGSGGVGGGAGAGPGILKVSASFLTMGGACTSPPATFAISNTGGSALTWNATLILSGQSLITVEPSSSTLLPGTQVTVSVNVKSPVASSGTSIFISINSDVAAQPSYVTVSYMVTGIAIDKQPDVDVGEAKIGSYKVAQVPTPSQGASFSLSSPDPAFSTGGLLSHGSDHWNLSFQPSVLGPQSATLEIGAPYVGGVCPQSNRFITVRGVGIP